MAQGVIQGASAACEFAVPEPPEGEELNLDTVVVKYSSAGQLVETFAQVPTAAECDDSSFYIEADTIHLCPEACAIVQSDEDAEIDVLYGCSVTPS